MDIPLRLDPARPEPLYRQLFEQIREAIVTDRLAPGMRLPSSRTLAARLGIARITVTNAYDQLVAEGYLTARVGSGTVVASDVHDDADRRWPRSLPISSIARPEPIRLSRYVRHLPTIAGFPRAPATPVEFDFRFGNAPAPFPMKEWQRVVAQQWSASPGTGLLSVSRQGDPGLRQELARYVGARRAVRGGPEQVVVTSGEEHALDLIAHLVLEPTDEVLAEDPGKPGARLVFRAHGARVIPVPVDNEGIDVDAVRRLRTRRTRILYLTPSRQHVTGVTLSMARRLALLDWAAANSVLIVEDDLDSAYRYDGATLASLQGLDAHEVVIYLGTYTRLLAHAAPMAYVVVPPALVAPAGAVHTALDRGPPLFVQRALAEFIRSGLLDRHVRTMQRLYVTRRNALLEALADCFAARAQVGDASAGAQVHVRFLDYPATDAMVATALSGEVGLLPVRPLYVRPPEGDPGVLMVYSGLEEHRIRAGVRRLAEVLDGSARA